MFGDLNSISTDLDARLALSSLPWSDRTDLVWFWWNVCFHDYYGPPWLMMEGSSMGPFVIEVFDVDPIGNKKEPS